MITIAHRHLAEIALLDISGRLIGEAGNQFLATASTQIVDGGLRKMVLNLKDLEQCDSMGISALLRIHTSLKNMDGRLVLCNLNDLVTKVFALTRIDEVMHITATEEEALEEMGVSSLLQEA
jgi:anti-anti-sigma factor